MSDYGLRLAVFNWLSEQTILFPETLPRKLLLEGFVYNDTRIPLVGPPGIFKPKVFELPLSITTTLWPVSARRRANSLPTLPDPTIIMYI